MRNLKVVFNRCRLLGPGAGPGLGRRVALAFALSGMLLVASGCTEDESSATAAATGSSTASAGGAGQGGSGGDPSGTGGEGSSGGGGEGVGGAGQGGGAALELYELESAITPGKSAINYAGQSLRHVLIEDMKTYLGGLTKAIDANQYSPPSVAFTVSALEYYYAFDDQTSGLDAHGIKTKPAPLQAHYAAIATGKNLKAKMAGNDPATDYQDWKTQFVGWQDASIAADGGGLGSPEALLQAFFHRVGKLALDRANGTIPVVPGTQTPLASVYVTGNGLDLQQLIQKLLLMGVSYSQGTDDYLDDDVMGSGLLAPNTPDADKPYTVLGHGWDEAFGYFGAARDYAFYTDDELAKLGGRPDWQGSHDTNGDSAIDLTAELNFGASATAAKRDLGSVDATDFTGDAFAALLAGRKLIQGAGAALTAPELMSLKAHRDQAVLAWEKAIAATCVHYLNEASAMTQAIGTMSYDFYAHAKAWSELKGFALGLQFNPRKKLTNANFAKLHTLLRDAPVLATATLSERQAYLGDLATARGLLQGAYGFSQANVEAW